MINGLISCIANTRTSVPPPSLLNVFLLPCYLPERSTGSCCPAWRPQWRASCPPTTLTCGRGMVACSGCTRTWTTSSAMDWGMSRSAHEAHIDLNNKPFFFCFCFNRTRMAFTKITPAYSHAWGKIKNADFARYVLCVLYLISRAVSVPSDSGMKTKTLCVALKVHLPWSTVSTQHAWWGFGACMYWDLGCLCEWYWQKCCVCIEKPVLIWQILPISW